MVRQPGHYEKYDRKYRAFKILSGLCIRCSRVREPYRMGNTTCRRCAVKLSQAEKRKKEPNGES